MASSERRFRTRHVVAISLGGTLIALSIALGLAVSGMRSADAAYARRLVAMGTIGRTGLGGNADVGEVLWQDQNHVSHTAYFHFAYPKDWTTGEAFGVSYDAGDPAGPVYAAGAFTDYVEDERDPTWVGVFVTSAILVGCVLGWLVRGLFCLRARSAPVSEWQVHLALGMQVRVTLCVYLLLIPVGEIRRKDELEFDYWQPVMWSPALAGFVNGQTVRVRLRDGSFGRAVVEAPDGSLIWPAGRLREGPALKTVIWPESWTFARPRMSAWALAFMLVIPFWAIIRVGPGGLTDMTAFVLATYGLLCFVWGMNGGLMARVPWETPRLT